MDRREILLDGLNLKSSVGLEIGPLANPIARKRDGAVIYVDYANTAALRQRYATDPNINTDRIVEVDAVWGQKTLQEAIGASQKVDYIVASHVIEHVPDLITWLDELHEVLAENGEVRLAIPDKRYTFDYLRGETRVADVVCAHLAKARIPQAHEIIDFILNKTQIDTCAAWRGEIKEESLPRDFTFEGALWLANDAQTRGTYHDVHCWVFTPHSFSKLMRDLAAAKMINFSCESFIETAHDQIEFFVTLRASGDEGAMHDSWQRMVDEAHADKHAASSEELEEAIRQAGETTKKLDIIKNALHERDAAIISLKKQLQVSQAAAEAYRSSTSWKITSPIRRIVSLFRG